MAGLSLFLKGMERLLTWLCMGLVLALALIVPFKVFFRYVLGDPIVWSDEAIMLMMLALTYFGAALACGRGGHISVDILETILARLGPGKIRMMRTIIDCATAVVLAIVAFYGVKIAFYSQNQVTELLLLSYFWVYLVLPTGLAFMVLMLVKRTVEAWSKPLA